MIDDGYDDLDYEDGPGRRWGAILYKWAVGLGAIAAVVFGGLYLVNSGPGGGEAAVAQKGDIPLIQAARGPVKIRPVKPGGRVVPHQDREVYREFDKAQRDKAGQKGRPKTTVEDLLAPRRDGQRAGRADRRKRLRYELVATGPTCLLKPTLSADLGLFRSATWRLARRKLNRVSTASGDPKRSAGGAAGQGRDDGRSEDSVAGVFRVQLGAFRSPTKAQKRWRGLKSRHKGLLGRLNMMIERVDLGPRGIFYRLQAGPIRTERSARGLCRSLGKRRVNCILVSG